MFHSRKRIEVSPYPFVAANFLGFLACVIFVSRCVWRENFGLWFEVSVFTFRDDDFQRGEIHVYEFLFFSLPDSDV